MENTITEIINSFTKKSRKQAQLTLVNDKLIFQVENNSYEVDISLVSKKIEKHLLKLKQD